MVCCACVKGEQQTSIRKKFGAEDYALDKRHGNTYWQDSIKSEMDSVMGKGTLAFPKTQAEQDNLKEQIRSDTRFQFAPMIWMVFDVKPISLKEKACLPLWDMWSTVIM